MDIMSYDIATCWKFFQEELRGLRIFNNNDVHNITDKVIDLLTKLSIY